MPDSRLDKTRDTLPEGYQFGDAALDSVFGAITPESRIILSIWSRNQTRERYGYHRIVNNEGELTIERIQPREILAYNDDGQ